MPGASGSSPTSCSTTPPTRTPGSRRPVRTRTARTATSTSGATPTPGTPGCGSSSATPSTPTGPWTRCASSTSGTGSSPTSRLDAITYLYEREGTNCANLPETHAYLKRLRKVVDDEYPGRVLLAEANLWPADLVAEVVDQVGRPQVRLGQQHPPGVLVVDHLAQPLEVCVGLRQVRAVGAFPLVQVGDGVQAAGGRRTGARSTAGAPGPGSSWSARCRRGLSAPRRTRCRCRARRRSRRTGRSGPNGTPGTRRACRRCG